MAAVFLPPLAVEPAIQSSNAVATAPASRVLLDEPGLVARGVGTLSVTFNMQGQSYDTVAVIRHSLRAEQRIRVRVGSDAAMATGVVFDQTFTAWSGAAPFDKAISYIPLPQLFSERFVAVDLIGSDGIDIEASRIIVGERIEVDGVDSGAQFTPVSGSTVDDGPGWTTVGEHRTRRSWEVNAGNVSRTSYYAEWSSFLNRVGKHAAFLFVPQSASDAIQHEAALMRFKDDPNVVDVTSSRYRVEMTLFEV
jgi:hypothetical protein